MTTIPALEHYPDLGESLLSGLTLPAEWYTDPAIFALEKDQIFRCSWQYAGLIQQAPNIGDFFTYHAGDVPIVVVRNEEGELRAFINVCRHRGSELVLSECGNRKSLQCHYHAWTYGLDGALRAAPGSKEEEGFDRGLFHLIPAQIDTWGPFIFVNPDPQAPPLAQVLGELPSFVDATGLELNAITRRVRHQYEIAANWKVVMDNYLECYHCSVAHPSFSDLIDVNDYHVTEYEYFSTQGGPVRESARAGKDNLYQIGEGVQDGFYAFLWPNFTLNVYPGPGNVSLNLILPVAPDRTVAIYEYCFVDAVGEQEEHDFVQFIDQVQREDIVLCESVQRGLSSGFFGQGRLMLSRENGLRHFQRLVHHELTE
jgi:choline monooxygenase